MSEYPHCGSENWHHDAGDVYCLRARLRRSEARHEITADAMQEFRHNIIHNPDISDDLRVTILTQLDTALNGEPI